MKPINPRAHLVDIKALAPGDIVMHMSFGSLLDREVRIPFAPTAETLEQLQKLIAQHYMTDDEYMPDDLVDFIGLLVQNYKITVREAISLLGLDTLEAPPSEAAA